MSKKNTTQEVQENLFKFSFGDDFIKHHAGQIVTDQNYAIVELIANAWDAGSIKVDIRWPEQSGVMQIIDNGIGMTKDELLYRWGKFNYNRVAEQGGKDAVFPKSVVAAKRKVFGRNGVGRHAMFCFSSEYMVETTKDGYVTIIKVTKSNGNTPYEVEVISSKKIAGNEHGTIISATIDTQNIKMMETGKVIELIGSRFISDPQFHVSVNGKLVQMTDISHLTEDILLPFGEKVIKIKRIKGETAKNTKQNGIAWWYNRRLIGTPHWYFSDNNLIDGRHPIAKQLLYIINVDFINEMSVKKDWSGFYISDEIIRLQNAVFEFIQDDIKTLLYETRKERRLQVYQTNNRQLRNLPPSAKQDIVSFIEEVQSKCPTIGINELEATVEVLAIMEKARSGYELLEKIALFNSNDVDTLNDILDRWTVNDAKKVLGELRWRLELISKLEKLLENPLADELHDLQPLFEHGLWIFGPEFEAIEFISNRSLATVIKIMLKDKAIDNERKRPDFVILPDSSIGVYSCDKYDSEHETSDFNKIVIVELKRGGIPIQSEQKDQALLYARELRKSKKVSLGTPIIAYVLGSEIVHEANEKMIEGQIEIIPCRYNVILRKAHARIFNLSQKIKEIKQISYESEMDEVFGNVSQSELFQ
jgi:Histidine kinase-, DNA gyrase B-, and HSP90-like ATPase